MRVTWLWATKAGDGGWRACESGKRGTGWCQLTWSYDTGGRDLSACRNRRGSEVVAGEGQRRRAVALFSLQHHHQRHAVLSTEGSQYHESEYLDFIVVRGMPNKIDADCRIQPRRNGLATKLMA